MYEVVADQVLGIYGPINGQVHIATRSFGNSCTMSAQIPTAPPSVRWWRLQGGGDLAHSDCDSNSQ